MFYDPTPQAKISRMQKFVSDNSIPNIRPVCIPPEGNIEAFTNKTAVLSGWGLKARGARSLADFFKFSLKNFTFVESNSAGEMFLGFMQKSVINFK